MSPSFAVLARVNNSFFFSCSFSVSLKLLFVTWYQSLYRPEPFLPFLLLMENNNAEILNPSHDLFLHPSDNPNNILVNETLNGRNYATWRKSMEIALIAKNKLGFVLGTTARPEAAALQNQWNRCDKMVISWILHAVEKKISDSILFSNTSSQIWPGRWHKVFPSQERSLLDFTR